MLIEPRRKQINEAPLGAQYQLFRFRSLYLALSHSVFFNLPWVAPRQKEEEQPDVAPRPQSLSFRSDLFLRLVCPKSDGILWPLIDEMSLYSQG